ncbi:MAG: N-acetyl-alpha-D-glucosaminyl L-malate synthase BshA [Myxococcaceae bacterium]
MTPLNIGITCFPTFGGSGLIASEIGLALADRGHRVHFIARDLPVRLHEAEGKVRFHEVTESDYPVLAQSSAYPIALASKMIEVAGYEQLDILHVHYAVPHATAAWMACEVMGETAPKIITTLHGTDITLVGTDPSHLPITRYSILRSDAVTTPSDYLRRATWDGFDIPKSFPIEVIFNFVDTVRYSPRRDRSVLRPLFADLQEPEAVLTHVSNFRPVKRIPDVVEIFADVQKAGPARLILIGDGPERSAAERSIRDRGLSSRVAFLGKRDTFVDLLAASDVFLLPSEQESFGLAALEAMACGVPVIASDIGGIPELVGDTGLLAPLGDTRQMAAHVRTLLRDREGYAKRARDRVLEKFQLAPAIDRYEALYRRVAPR